MNLPSNFNLKESLKFVSVSTDIEDRIDELYAELEESQEELDVLQDMVNLRDIFIEDVMQDLDEYTDLDELVANIRLRFKDSKIKFN